MTFYALAWLFGNRSNDSVRKMPTVVNILIVACQWDRNDIFSYAWQFLQWNAQEIKTKTHEPNNEKKISSRNLRGQNHFHFRLMFWASFSLSLPFCLYTLTILNHLYILKEEFMFSGYHGKEKKTVIHIIHWMRLVLMVNAKAFYVIIQWLCVRSFAHILYPPK